MKALPQSLPVNTVDLLRLLDESIPHRCPGRGEDAEEVQRYAGMRELVDLLLSRQAGPEDERREETYNWFNGGAV